MTVLIMGDAQDANATNVLHTLSQRGVAACLLNTCDFPQKVRISWHPQEANGSLMLADGTELQFQDIQSVYWRNLNFPQIPECADAYQMMLAERDCMSTLRTFLNGTPARWVNSWYAYDSHKEKPLQLAKVHALGVKIPQTIVSNCVSQITEFYKHCPKAIFKPVYGGAHTEVLTEEHMDPERLNQVLNISPITIQAYIAGTNIRTYVVGDKIFSAEIRSPSVDFREDEAAQLLPVELPEALSKKCLDITHTLGLAWTAIDWRKDASGDYYFLEANPSPMFVHFENVTGHPITQALVDLLLSENQVP